VTAASGSAARDVLTSLWPWWPLISSRTAVDPESNRHYVHKYWKRIAITTSLHAL